MRLEVAPLPLPDTDLPQMQIDQFTDRYGEAHLWLLYHAAFPLSLTSELLYQLRENFPRDINGQDIPIPWIAVSDVLFSSFCKKVGHNLYELKPDLRRKLLNRLNADPRLGKKRLKELAQFILVYTEAILSDSSDSADRNFAQVQQWGAIAQLQPHIAARELAKNLTKAYQNDFADLNRIAEIVQRLSEPLANYPMLLDYAQGMARYARGDEAGAINYFQKLLIGEKNLSIEGILLPLPEELPLAEPNKEKTKLPVTSKVGIYRVVLIFSIFGVITPLVIEWIGTHQTQVNSDSTSTSTVEPSEQPQPAPGTPLPANPTPSIPPTSTVEPPEQPQPTPGTPLPADPTPSIPPTSTVEPPEQPQPTPGTPLPADPTPSIPPTSTVEPPEQPQPAPVTPLPADPTPSIPPTSTVEPPEQPQPAPVTPLPADPTPSIPPTSTVEPPEQPQPAPGTPLPADPTPSIPPTSTVEPPEQPQPAPVTPPLPETPDLSQPTSSQLVVADIKGAVTFREASDVLQSLEPGHRLNSFTERIFIPGDSESFVRLFLVSSAPVDNSGFAIQLGPVPQDTWYSYPCRAGSDYRVQFERGRTVGCLEMFNFQGTWQP